MWFMHTDKLAHLTKAQQGQIASNTAFNFVQKIFHGCANFSHSVGTGLNASLRTNSPLPFLGGLFTNPVTFIIGGIMALGTAAYIFMFKKGQKKQAECRAAQAQQEAMAKREAAEDRGHPGAAERISPLSTPAMAAAGGSRHKGGR